MLLQAIKVQLNNDKIENIARSVSLSPFMDRAGNCNIPHAIAFYVVK
jgi:hypothetical protein